jgi:RNA recognition motif-containing protein
MNIEHTSIIQPNETLYVKNLNEKVKENILKDSLSKLFSQYGSILDIKIKNNIIMKGQAFIIFKEISEAEEAMSKLQGKLIFNKELKIFYSKQKSDCLLKEKGLLDENKYNHRKEETKSKRDTFYKELKSKLLSNKRKLNTGSTQSRKLFIDNIETNIEENDLLPLFSKINGFKNLFIIKDKKVCFVEYENETQASQALLVNNKVVVNGIKLNIYFAKTN